MATRITPPNGLPTSNAQDVLKSWIMVFLTFGFVVLYALALLGKLKPLADVSMVSRIEPTIFVIIGYYFGRLPSQQNEETLKDEIGRQTQKADAAQHAKEQAIQTREAIEERLKNSRAALSVAFPNSGSGGLTESHSSEPMPSNEELRHSVNTTIKILDS